MPIGKSRQIKIELKTATGTNGEPTIEYFESPEQKKGKSDVLLSQKQQFDKIRELISKTSGSKSGKSRTNSKYITQTEVRPFRESGCKNEGAIFMKNKKINTQTPKPGSTYLHTLNDEML